MIELITITRIADNWYLNKVSVNSQHIATIVESQEHSRLLREGKIDLPLDAQVTFSKVQMVIKSGFNEFIVVGSPSAITEKLNHNTKQLLKG